MSAFGRKSRTRTRLIMIKTRVCMVRIAGRQVRAGKKPKEFNCKVVSAVVVGGHLCGFLGSRGKRKGTL